jgi:dihydroflavonol-4-reductase
MPSALITGARGFLGGHIARHLLEEGWQVTALLRPDSDGTALSEAGVSVVHAPMDNHAEVTHVMPPAVDAVFHVAGNTSLWRKGNERQYRDNVLGTRAMVTAALRNQVGRFVYTSSISAWGIQEGTVDESTSPNMAEDWIGYNQTKFQGEEEVLAGVHSGLDAVILNPCAIIGSGDTHNWSQMITLINEGKLPGVPPGSSNFCSVREVARAHVKAWQQGRTAENYILGGVEASFLELAQTIGELLGKPAPKRTLSPRLLRFLGQVYPIGSLFTGKEPRFTPEKVAMLTNRVRANSRKAVEELGFDESVPLETMLRDCIDWMRETGRL